MPSEAVTFRLPVPMARGLLRLSLGFFFLSKLCTRAGTRLLLFTLTIATDIGREVLAISPMLEEGICQLLQADRPLNDDLELGGRITLLLVPVDLTYPCVSLLNISEVSDHTADGPSGYVDHRVQIDAWGRSYKAVRDIQERIAQVLEAFTGALPDSNRRVPQVSRFSRPGRL